MEATDEALDRAAQILESHGIKMTIWACGCCDSPMVKMTYNGEYILGNKKELADEAQLHMLEWEED